jgi:hypothetical protein
MIGMKTYVHFFFTPMLLGVVDVLVVLIVATIVIDVLVVVELNEMSPKSMIERC